MGKKILMLTIMLLWTFSDRGQTWAQRPHIQCQDSSSLRAEKREGLFNTLRAIQHSVPGETEVLDGLSNKIKSCFEKRLKQAKDIELRILAHILSLSKSAEHFEEILRGAHVWILDDGEFYKKWSKSKMAEERISSHPNMGEQFGISGKSFGQLLFGKLKNSKGKMISWFQFERTPFSSDLKNVLLHGCDYVQYLLTGKNVGPYGQSEKVDSLPLKFLP